jgi:hypothetical protein
MTKFLAVLLGVLALLLLGTTAQAKPAPAPQPYTPAYETVTESVTLASSGAHTTIRATCPDGKSVTGGGFSSDRAPNDIVEFLVTSSYPDSDGKTWVIVVGNNGQQVPIQVRVYAICANTQ